MAVPVPDEAWPLAGMPPPYREMVRRLVAALAAHALAAAQLVGRGIAHAPDVASMQLAAVHLDERLERYERLRDLYRTAAAEDVRERIEPPLRRLPLAGSWLELAVMRLALDAAELLQLGQLRRSSFPPLAEAADRFLSAEERRDGFGLRMLLRAHGREPRPLALQRHFDRWLPAAVRALGRPGSAGNSYAVAAGLKARDSGEAIRDLANRLRPAMRYLGLAFPPREALAVELPPGLELEV